MAMENKRIIQLSTERTTLGDDDYTIVDSDTNGTAKYRLSRLKETDTTLSVSGMAADAAATGSAISAEATARGNAVTAEAEARTAAVAAEAQARQQAIIAESQARAAADTTLGNDVQDLKSAISDLTGNTTYAYATDKSVGANDIPNQVQEVGWESVVVTCQEGDVFCVKGKGGNSTRLWMFADSNGTVLTTASGGVIANDYITITAPENAYYLCCNSQYTVTKGSLYKNALLRNEVDIINSEIAKCAFHNLIPFFAVGEFSETAFAPTSTTRVCTKESLSFSDDVKISLPVSVASNWNVLIWVNNNGSFSVVNLKQKYITDTEYYCIIPKNTQFYVQIHRNPETSEPANIVAFTENVYIEHLPDLKRFEFPVTWTDGKMYTSTATAFDALASTSDNYACIEPTSLVSGGLKYDVIIESSAFAGVCCVALYDINKNLLHSESSVSNKLIKVNTADYDGAYYFKVSEQKETIVKYSVSKITISSVAIKSEVDTEQLKSSVDSLSIKVEENSTTISELISKWDNLFNKDASGVLNGKLWNGAVDTNDAFRTSDYIEIRKPGYYVLSGIAYNTYGDSYNQAVACYDSAKQYLYNADCTLLSDSGYTRSCKFSLTSAVKYIRFTLYASEIANTMMFEGQTLPEAYMPYGTTIHIQEAVIQADNLNPLSGKVAVFDGDSICASSTDRSNKGSYAGRIGDANGLVVHNEGVSGGTITDVPTVGHNLSTYIDTIHTLYPDLDYLILEGGINDSNLMGDIRGGATPEGFGSYDMHDFSGNYDSTKFCGAVETLFYKAINYYTGKKIGFIIAPKFGRQVYDYTPENSNLSAYFEVVKAICKKWGIPYLDLWNNCYMNPKLTVCYDYTMTDEENVIAGKLYFDGGHPAPAGYNYIAPIIGDWMKTL